MVTSEQIRVAVGASTITEAMKLLSVEYSAGEYKCNGVIYKDFDAVMNYAIALPKNERLFESISKLTKKNEEEFLDAIKERRFSKIPENVLKSYAKDNIALTTAHRFLTCDVHKELGVVSVDLVYGLNVVKDIFSSFTDFFGGRSKTIESAISKSKEEAIDELKLQTLLKGGNAVIALTLSTTVNDGKFSMLKVTALGTAVVILA